MIDVSNDVQQIETRTAAALSADPSIDGILAAGPHVCDAANKAIKDVGADVHLACFDMSDAVTAMLRSGDASFTIDQQQRLQGYMPIIVLHLYNTNAGMLPGANIPSGPGFVDASNIDNVASNFADTEQSILIISVACATTFPPVNNSSELPAGMLTSFTNKTVSFVSVSDVSDTN